MNQYCKMHCGAPVETYTCQEKKHIRLFWQKIKCLLNPAHEDHLSNHSLTTVDMAGLSSHMLKEQRCSVIWEGVSIFYPFLKQNTKVLGMN